MLKKSLFIAGILIVPSLFASCVVVPHQPDSRPPVDEVGQCLKENRKRHDDVQQMFRRAASGGRISDSEAARFQSLERRLDDIRYNLYRDGITLSDCQRLGREIAVERANVQRMTATPVRNPQIDYCRQDNRRDHEDVWQLFLRAKSAERISKGEARLFKDMEHRLSDIKRRLSLDGLSQSKCQAISREIARERESVQRMAATPARDQQIDRCRQDNRRDHEDVWQLFLRAKVAGRISKDEARHFKDMEHRLSDIKRRLSFEGLSLSECQAINSEIARERDAVRRMTDSERRY